MDQTVSTSTPADFRTINSGKADFDVIYDDRDPRAYFRVLGGLDYVVPGLAAPVFQQLVAARAAQQQKPVTILDLGCSYGITSALLRFPLSFDQLRGRYMHPRIQELSSDKMLELDRAYFSSWPGEAGVRVIGLDPSTNAVKYATEVGILDAGIDEELENHRPSAAAREALADVDIVISTGCVGYITERTFDAILGCNKNGRTPWIASFVLRMFPYDAIDSALTRHGLTTEKFDGATFVQRRFHNVDEYEQTLQTLEAQGIDPEGLETTGLLHAELFVSRPEALIEEKPLNRLVSIVSGQRVRFGRRFHRINGDEPRQLLLN